VEDGCTWQAPWDAVPVGLSLEKAGESPGPGIFRLSRDHFPSRQVVPGSSSIRLLDSLACTLGSGNLEAVGGVPHYM
jgi:hypothetical protein